MATGTVVGRRTKDTVDPQDAKGHAFGPMLTCQRHGCGRSYEAHLKNPRRCRGKVVKHDPSDSKAAWREKLEVIGVQVDE